MEKCRYDRCHFYFSISILIWKKNHSFLRFYLTSWIIRCFHNNFSHQNVGFFNIISILFLIYFQVNWQRLQSRWIHFFVNLNSCPKIFYYWLKDIDTKYQCTFCKHVKKYIIITQELNHIISSPLFYIRF